MHSSSWSRSLSVKVGGCRALISCMALFALAMRVLRDSSSIEVGDGNRDRIVLESSFNCLHYKGSNVEHTWSRASTVGEQMERPQLPIYLIVQ